MQVDGQTKYQLNFNDFPTLSVSNNSMVPAYLLLHSITNKPCYFRLFSHRHYVGKSPTGKIAMFIEELPVCRPPS